MLSKLERGECVLEGFTATLGTTTNREPALEAAIADAPDDPDAYLVYGDWLQARGDVRGTLIALHDAARQAPNGDADAAAAALLDSHARTFLGDLYMRNDVELVWFQGFIREIRLRFHTVQLLLSAVRALFAIPAGAFVQAITIDHLQEVDRVISLVLERAPRTLAHLAIGKPRQWSVPPEVLDRFPRMTRDPAILWADAIAAAATHERLALDFDPAALPALEFHPGITPVPHATILRGLKAELGKKLPVGMLAALRAVASGRSLDQFALALTTQWEVRSSARTLWALEAIGTLGGDASVGYLAERFETWTHPRAVQALEHLRTIGTNAAITAIAGFAANAALPGPRRAAAIAMLEEIALTRNVDSLTQLLARTCPRGPTSLGGRRIVAQQRRWLLDLMIDGQRLSIADFSRMIAGHPLRRPLAAGLVWGEFAGGTLRTAFTLDRDTTLRARDGSPHVLGDGSVIGVVHPLELPRDQRTGWTTVESPPFEQLTRPLYTLTAAEGARDELTRFANRRVGVARLVERLVGCGWAQSTDSDGACYKRELPRDNVIARAQLDRGAVTVRVRRVSHWENRRLDAHHPVTISELLYDLERVHA